MAFQMPSCSGACAPLSSGGDRDRLLMVDPPIEIYTLSVNEISVATNGGFCGGGRFFCAIFIIRSYRPLRG